VQINKKEAAGLKTTLENNTKLQKKHIEKIPHIGYFAEWRLLF
jgi:hypothetical protein